MGCSSDDPRLKQMSTQWTLVFRAHGVAADEAVAARAVLMDRNAGAVHRYLLGALHDEEAAGELVQEFALRFLHVDLHRADPSKGWFRDFVARALHNMVVDDHRRKRILPLAMDAIGEAAEPAEGPSNFLHTFRDDWRRELLARSWRSLGECSRKRAQPLDSVLRCRVAYPDARPPVLAGLQSKELGRPVSAEWVRKNLQRARDLFSASLLDEVESSLDRPSRAELEGELNELGLREYCRLALAKRGE